MNTLASVTAEREADPKAIASKISMGAVEINIQLTEAEVPRLGRVAATRWITCAARTGQSAGVLV